MKGSNYSLTEIIDLSHVQRLADRFCKVTNIFAYAVDEEGNRLTNASGVQEETEKIFQYLEEGQKIRLLSRVEKGSLEEQAVEETEYGNLKAAAIAIKIDNRHLMTWLICAVTVEEEEGKPCILDIHTKIAEKSFYHALDLLRDTSYVVLENKLSLANAKAENIRSRNSENEMEQSLKRIEATTEIVQLLDSDIETTEVVAAVLKIIGSYFQTASAQIYEVNRETETMDVVCEWCREGVVSAFDKTKGIPMFPFLKKDKTLVLSSDSFAGSEAGEILAESSVTAIMVFPIAILEQKEMYLCLMEQGKKRMWQIEEIRFNRDVVKLLQSMIHKRLQNESLRTSYTAMEAILDNIDCGIYVRDRQKKEMLFANKWLKDVFAPEIAMETFNDLLEQGIPARKESDNRELYYEKTDQWYDMLFTNVTWVDGKEASLFCLYDITDRKVYQRKIEQQAYTDFLTGLYNRMCCERDLAWHIDNAKKHHSTGALLYLDLDDFKHINDGLGHRYGDVLLKAISHSLCAIEGIENTCYRMGGDEFVIIIPPESYDRFKTILEKIKEIFSRPWFLKDADYYCTMSMGIVKYPESGESVQDLIVKADIAMYEAKKTGKNRVENYREALGSHSNRRLDMEKNMRDATANGYKEFEVYFQPITDIQLEGMPCTGAEALIRWNSAELGFIAPSDFIPLAEYLGLINPIGNYVLKTACEACRHWNENGHPNYKVNVNLSVIQLLQPDIVDMVAETVAETGINPRNLTLEVTESLAINDMDRMKEILGKIKELGVRIALDDFGTGYSSLNHIREIPFDVIKVDQSFVRELADDAYSQSFIKMVSELADTIGVSICVEGIETKEQYKVLEGMKVRLVQGYYFDRPMPQDKFEEKYCK